MKTVSLIPTTLSREGNFGSIRISESCKKARIRLKPGKVACQAQKVVKRTKLPNTRYAYSRE